MKNKLKFIIPMLLSASFAANAQDLERILSEAAGDMLSEQCTIELETAENEMKALLKEDIERGQDLYNSFNKMVEDYRTLKREELNQVNAEILSIQHQQNALKEEWNNPRTTVARREELRVERAELNGQKQDLQNQAMILGVKLASPASFATQENNQSLKDINIQGERQIFKLKFPKQFVHQNGKLAIAALGGFSTFNISNSGNWGESLSLNGGASGAGFISLQAPVAEQHFLQNSVIGGSKGIKFEKFTTMRLSFNEEGRHLITYWLTRWDGATESQGAHSESELARFLISEPCQAEYDIIKEEHGQVLGYLPEFQAPRLELAGVESLDSERFLDIEPNLEPISPIQRGSQVNKN